MGSATIRGGFDTWAGSAYPAREHGGDRYLRIDASTDLAFLYLKSPVPRGATVLSATLKVRARGSSSGSRTLTARRVAESWKASKLNWNNKPGVVGPVVAVAVGALSDRQTVSFDVTAHVQSVANGSPHYGWRIETTGTTPHKLYGLDAGIAKPTLEVTWSDKPDAPTTLVPSAAAVSVEKPILQFDYTDVSGSVELVAIQVQIDAAADAVSPDFDSGEVATTIPELDLTTTAYAGLADAASTQWRVRVKDGAGLWSDWSDWVTFSRDNLGTLAINNPAADPNDFVSESTPPITWSLTGETQAAWQVRIFDAEGDLIYDSGKRPGTANSHTLPSGVITVDGATYTVLVRAWDTKTREATPGAPVYVSASRAFTFEYDATVDPPATLTAAQVGDSPWVDLTFTRTTAPDSWTIVRDGIVVEDSVDPADVFTSGTTYVWRDWTAAPRKSHTYRVSAVVGGAAASAGPTAAVTTDPRGIWLGDPNSDADLVVLGQDSGSWTHGEESSTYIPKSSTKVTRTVGALRGLEGNISGVLADAFGLEIADHEAALLWMKEHPTQIYRLVLADINIPVVLGNVTIAPSLLTSEGDVFKNVDLAFWQSGELGFTPRL